MFASPLILRLIDFFPRKKILKAGLLAQNISLVSIWGLLNYYFIDLKDHQNFSFYIPFGVICLLGAISSLGSNLTNISVGYDIASDFVMKKDLPLFNSRLKRIDLFTEVSAPILAGILFTIPSSLPLNLGFTLIVIFNIASLFPEYFLISTIRNLDLKLILVNEKKNLNPFKEVKLALKDFNDPTFKLPMISIALLCCTVLTPTSVFLTGHMVDGKHLDEMTISFYRGLGAIFGMIPTFIAPIVQKKLGVEKTAKLFLGLQATSLFMAALFFEISFVMFLSFILLSRIGLYGFTISESQIRQAYISKEKRGRINGLGMSINAFATLFLFAVGAYFHEKHNFNVLIWTSSISVSLSFLLLLTWKLKNDSNQEKIQNTSLIELAS